MIRDTPFKQTHIFLFSPNENAVPGVLAGILTATISNWKDLLKDDRFKDIIIDSLNYLKKDNRIKINAFVIMINHIHLIWQALHGHVLKDVQASFAGHTAKAFLKAMIAEKNLLLYRVNAADRNHNFWKRDPLGIELFTPAVFQQKLEYIHYNPLKAGLGKYPEDYKYSSAGFYHYGYDHTGLLEHWAGE